MPVLTIVNSASDVMVTLSSPLIATVQDPPKVLDAKSLSTIRFFSSRKKGRDNFDNFASALLKSNTLYNLWEHHCEQTRGCLRCRKELSS